MAGSWLINTLGTPESHLHDYSLVQKTGLWGFRTGCYWKEWIDTGMKTQSNRVIDVSLPGVYRDLVGATITEWHALPPGVQYDLQTEIPGVESAAMTWAEAIAPEPETQVYARYSAGPIEGAAALVKKDIGEGSVWYLGWYPTLPQMVNLLTHLANQQQIPYFMDLPEGVVVYSRDPFLAALNFTDDMQTILIRGRSITIGSRNIQIVQTE